MTSPETSYRTAGALGHSYKWWSPMIGSKMVFLDPRINEYHIIALSLNKPLLAKL
jgi:hypothetical protein